VIIAADNLPQILWVEPCRKCRRSDEVTEHDRELTTLGFGEPAADAGGFVRGFGRSAGRSPLLGGRFASQRSNRIDQDAAMSNRRHADIFEVLGRQLRQNCSIDRVLAECRLVLREAKAPQPTSEVHD
jgi:hypothetical protein